MKLTKIQKKELTKLQDATGKFVGVMYQRLRDKFIEEDFKGWRKPSMVFDLCARLRKKAESLTFLSENKQFIDIANLSMFVYFLRKKKEFKIELTPHK